LIQTYRFLRIYTAGWPHDASITGLVALWHVFLSAFGKPFVGLQVVGRDLLEHLTVSLGHLGSVSLNQVDWQAMNSQLSVLLQCSIAILGKIANNLPWLQAWEEQLPGEAREQIRKYEIESFKMRPFLSEEDVAEALALVLERLNGMLEYSEPMMHDNQQLIQNCASMLQKCFLVRVDFSKPLQLSQSVDTSASIDRLGRKRTMIEKESGHYSSYHPSLVAAVWRQLLSSPATLYAAALVMLASYIWLNYL
jgi:hypothetical protein